MKTQSLTKLSLAVVLAALSALGAAQITKQGGGYLLRMKFKSGEVVKYTMTTTSTGGASMPAMNFKMPMVTKVLSVKGGIGEIEYTVGPMTNNGKAVGQQQKVTAKVDSRGKITGGSAQLQQMGNITFPEQPIKVGGTWKGTQTTPAGPGGSFNLNATYKLIGIKTVGGKPVAEIGVTMNGGNQMMKTSGTGVLRLLLSDGSLHSTTLDQSITISQGQQAMVVKNKVSITRQ